MDWHSIFDQARSDAAFLFPEAMLVSFGLAILLTDFLLGKSQKSWHALTAMLGVAFSGASLFVLVRPAADRVMAFSNSIAIDPSFIFIGFAVLAATALVILLSVRYLEEEEAQSGAYYALVLFAAVGMLFVACGNDLAVILVALETMAISLYILAGYLGRNRLSNEAAMKQMLTGAFATAILAYGFSILYGIAGSTNLQVIQATIRQRHTDYSGADLLMFLALATIAAALLLKVAAVPFHQWAPDVLQGAPTTISAFASAASLAASLALLLRLLVTVFWPANLAWSGILEAAGALSLMLGTLAALTQNNVKRLLAYSSIAQAGYMLLGVTAAVNRDGSFNPRGLQAVAFYLFAYVFFNTGAFAVLIVLRQNGSIGDEIDDLNGLAYRNPAAAVSMLIFVLSLAGIPLTTGFIAKFLVFWSLMEAGHPYLAALGVLCILPAVYSYLRIVAAMWSRDSSGAAPTEMTAAESSALAIMALVTVAAGIFPEQLLRFAKYSILTPLGL